MPERSRATKLVGGAMAVSLTFAAFLLIIDGIFPKGDAGQYPYGYRCSDGNVEVPWWHLFPETRDNPEAFWTAIGSMIGIAALCFIWIQIRKTEEANAAANRSAKAAEEANRENKRSTDLYVESERGRLALTKIWEDDGDFRIHPLFENMGKGPLWMIQIMPMHKVIHKGAKFPWARVQHPGMAFTDVPIQVGHGITTHPTLGVNVVRAAEAWVDVAPEDQALLKQDHVVALVYVIRYRTFGDHWYYARIAVKKTFFPKEVWEVEHAPRLTYEKPMVPKSGRPRKPLY